MKVFRFMSLEELQKYLNGEKLLNTTKHESHTNSIGFCFMNYKDNDPEEAIEFLSGIVDNELCAEFETDESNLNKSYGVYADPYGAFFDTITEAEYCTQKYSKENFKLLRIATLKYNYENFKWNFNWYTDIDSGLEIIIKKREKKEKEKKIKEEKNKLWENVIEQKKVNLQEFWEETMRTGKIHIRIKDRYYEVPTHVESLSTHPIAMEQPLRNVDGDLHNLEYENTQEIAYALEDLLKYKKRYDNLIKRIQEKKKENFENAAKRINETNKNSKVYVKKYVDILLYNTVDDILNNLLEDKDE